MNLGLDFRPTRTNGLVRTLTKPGYATVIIPDTTYTKISELAKRWNKSKSAVLTELANSRPTGMIPSTHSIILFRQNGLKKPMAGRVGFEPTICGSAGRRLSPGSTTGPLVAEHGNHRLIINSDEHSQRGHSRESS